LSFSYWIDNLGFVTEGKLAAIFIKPYLGVSNWPVILLHQQTQSSFLASSSPRHQSAKPSQALVKAVRVPGTLLNPALLIDRSHILHQLLYCFFHSSPVKQLSHTAKGHWHSRMPTSRTQVESMYNLLLKFWHNRNQ
jgi:hypothetical protein